MRVNVCMGIVFLVFSILFFCLNMFNEGLIYIIGLGTMSCVFLFAFDNFGIMTNNISFKDKISTITFYIIWIIVLSLDVYKGNLHWVLIVSVISLIGPMITFICTWIKNSRNNSSVQVVQNMDRDISLQSNDNKKVTLKTNSIEDRLGAIE